MENRKEEFLKIVCQIYMAAYGAVFLTALRTYRKNFLAVLLLLTYGIHSLISFQQVLNAPFFSWCLEYVKRITGGKTSERIEMRR